MIKQLFILFLTITAITKANNLISIMPRVGFVFNEKIEDKNYGIKLNGDPDLVIGLDLLYGNPDGIEYGIGFQYHNLEINNHIKYKTIKNQTIHLITRYNFDIDKYYIPFIFGRVGLNFAETEGYTEVKDGTTLSFGVGFSYQNIDISLSYNRFKYEQKHHLSENIENYNGNLEYDNITLDLSYRISALY